ncbi:MAG: hypothetical protein KJN90_14090 [Gammaproteobacteria bacterium]|nr:hypothetical protein [Gammaproteobacteria bacterium]
MKLNSISLGLAAANTAAIFWLACSAIVALLPAMSMNMGGYMMHADFSSMNWNMSLFGFLSGLILWTLSVGIFASLMAAIYNRLI